MHIGSCSSRVKNNFTRPVQSLDNSFHTLKATFDLSNVRPATNAIATSESHRGIIMA